MLSPRDVHALDPIGLKTAVSEVRAALEEMADALNAASREVQIAAGADLHLMSRAVSRALDRLDSDVVPVVDPSLVYDLNLLADIAHAATDELRATAGDASVDPQRAERLDRLAEAANARLIEINLVIDGWTERSRNAVVELTEEGGTLVVRSTDRLVYNGIRYVSIGLLLVGLLVLGLQLLRMSEDRVEWLPLLRETPVLSSLAVAALTIFFVGAAAFGARPGLLATLSAEVRLQPQEHPCERLAAQRDRLVAAQQIDEASVIEATKQRMRPAARDCLGLPSGTATAEAIEHLAERTAVTWSAPRLARPPRFAAEPAEPAPNAADMAVMSLPAAEAETAETAEPAAGSLAEPPQEGRAAVDQTVDDRNPPAEPAPSPQRAPDQTAALETPPEPERADAAPQPPPADAVPELGPADAVPPGIPEPRPADEAGAPGGLDGASNDDAALPSTLYVTTSAVNYRAGPSRAARRLGTFVLGAELEVVRQDAGWAEVRLRDGRDVYVASEFLERAR